MSATTETGRCFPREALAAFRDAYPNAHRKLAVTLHDHPLLDLEPLARLAESLPESSIEYNKGDLPTGIAPEDVPANELSIGETIRRIDEADSWAVLKNIEQDPAYCDLLHGLLDELRDTVEPVTGPMLQMQGYVFVSSPNAVTPFHFDPEHNILIQLRGEKDMQVFPIGDTRFAADEDHESYHSGGHRNLVWNDAFAEDGEVVRLCPGDAIYVPVMAPHYVRNTEAPSLSLSITWRSRWSKDEANTRLFNKRLRRLGLTPTPPNRFPATNRIRSILERVLRRLWRG